MAHRQRCLVQRMAPAHGPSMALAASLPAPLPKTAALARIVVPIVGAAMLLPGVSSGVALLAGVGVALTLGNPWPARSRALGHQALTWSVVGLGAGMNLAVVGRVGLHGL